MKKLLPAIVCLCAVTVYAQKKPLDHSVYDQWQSITERTISNDGKYVAYTINPQEGDGVLVIQAVNGSYKQEIARGYSAVVSNDNRFVICRIKPPFKDTRDARIKKKKPEDMPKDSLGMIDLVTGRVTKMAGVKSFKMPDETGTWLAYLLEKALPETNRLLPVDSLTRINNLLTMADSLAHAADSLRNKANAAKEKGMGELQVKASRNTTTKTPDEPIEEGTDLVLTNLATGETRTFHQVSEYFFNRKGNALVLETTRKNNDPSQKASVIYFNLDQRTHHTILVGFNDAKGYQFDEAGNQLAFVAERDSSSKALQKFYRLYYYKTGADSAVVVADRKTKGIPANWTVSENSNISFSKNGARLFFGTAPILPAKDTSLPEFERVNVDIWHYKDDYIQPVQLKNLDNELKHNYLARADLVNNEVIQLATDKMRQVVSTGEGDGQWFYGTADDGKRIATQWQGFSLNDVYRINPESGVVTLIRKDLKGTALYPSYSGKYLLFFDERKQHYYVYSAVSGQLHPVAADITSKLYDEDNDVPDDPNAYGVVKWMENDQYVLVYDRYDIWKVDAEGKEKSIRLTNGRKDKIQLRYVNTDPDERIIKDSQQLLLRLYDEKDKGSGIALLNLAKQQETTVLFKEPKSLGLVIQKAKNAGVISYTKESYTESPNLYVQPLQVTTASRLSNINRQQADYNWGTAELFKWKAYTGKETEGVLYKPEGFDSHKKYPMIVYFYERNNNTLNNYIAPAPTPSRLNISFFVSRGYIVFVPDIWYKTGYPGQSAYDYIVSGTRAVVKQGFVDSTRIGLQGQSWGGYQIVYLITKTNLYAAAWAGAPVANMTSAYGGIRWGTGLNRQFQYEKTQSRIGATLWEKPERYLQNSALFSLPKVTTPLVIMANDADDAVPWYQGIEMYTGMRRLGKKVWMLNYNNEAHNLIERKNRKDIQVREQQFFDYLLKGEKPAKWISEGVPAVIKGRDWGLGY
ncbi:MAG: S9 family peptidase [Sediminibacterium magnilacihabitans]|jgi:dipeptidyl aminopeptidase/acylaminoacyl peptidase|nr:S9 family peptidase [Sediminibacterium magnilacihabitans]PQV61328.1 dipeptidyl aminopeptidase/acylaminoacyl peptidase [Sediminibacterium magnilacihabitans]